MLRSDDALTRRREAPPTREEGLTSTSPPTSGARPRIRLGRARRRTMTSPVRHALAFLRLPVHTVEHRGEASCDVGVARTRW